MFLAIYCVYIDFEVNGVRCARAAPVQKGAGAGLSWRSCARLLHACIADDILRTGSRRLAGILLSGQKVDLRPLVRCVGALPLAFSRAAPPSERAPFERRSARHVPGLSIVISPTRLRFEQHRNESGQSSLALSRLMVLAV